MGECWPLFCGDAVFTLSCAEVLIADQSMCRDSSGSGAAGLAKRCSKYLRAHACLRPSDHGVGFAFFRLRLRLAGTKAGDFGDRAGGAETAAVAAADLLLVRMLCLLLLLLLLLFLLFL